jgi:hypothetical protein
MAEQGESSTTTSTDGNDQTGSTQSGEQSKTQPASAQTFTQADLDRVVAERLSREKAKYSDYDQLKTRAEQWDKFVAESKTQQEKELDQARKDAADAARAETRQEFGSKLVDAHLTAAATGRMTPEALTALLAGVNKSAFLTDGGDVDATKVTQFIDGIAPATAAGPRVGGFGQGPRTGAPAGGIDAGAAVWEARHAKGAMPPLIS